MTLWFVYLNGVYVGEILTDSTDAYEAFERACARYPADGATRELRKVA